MPTRDVTDFAEIVREPELAADEVSSERFDRLAFAQRALALVRPHATRVALCEGRTRVRLDVGRNWGKGDDARWAVLRVPPTASKRAIAVAVVALAPERPEPWVLDVLLGEIADEKVA